MALLGITAATEKTYLIIIGHGQTVAAIVQVGENAHHNESWAMEQFTNEQEWRDRYFELTGNQIDQ